MINNNNLKKEKKNINTKNFMNLYIALIFCSFSLFKIIKLINFKKASYFSSLLRS